MKRRRVILNPVQVAMEGARKLHKGDILAVKTILEANLVAFSAGDDPRSHWMSMADALNMAEALCDLGIASDANSRKIIEDGHAVMAQVAERATLRGSWTLRYDEERGRHERDILDLAIWMHQVQLEHCSMREYERAMQRVQAKVAGALRGQAGKGVKVVIAPPRASA